MSISQLQYISGTSSATFDKWASQHQSIGTCTDDIGEGAKLHWIGNKKSNKIMFHLHGQCSTFTVVLPLTPSLQEVVTISFRYQLGFSNDSNTFPELCAHQLALKSQLPYWNTVRI